MRVKFIANIQTTIEKEFWKQFFNEIDKRSFIFDEFKVKDFGLRINNKHLIDNTKDYSLMFSRNGLFVMNNRGFNGEKWDGLNRLKNWCKTSNLPEYFYSELNKRKLLTSHKKSIEVIDIPALLKYKTPSELVYDLFQCLDFFQ